MAIQVQRVTNIDDLNGLNDAVPGIIGEVFWRLNIGYGEELFLHIGEPRLISLPPSKVFREKVGSWRLETRGTDWRIEASENVLAPINDSEDKIKHDFHALLDKTISKFEITYPSLGLTMTFADGNKFIILPKAEDDTYDLPYWVLVTPQHAVIEVGPQKQWSISTKD